jgi:hypothetical protein
LRFTLDYSGLMVPAAWRQSSAAGSVGREAEQ